MQLPEVAALLSLAAQDDDYKVASCDEVLRKTGPPDSDTFIKEASRDGTGFAESARYRGLSLFEFLKHKEYLCIEKTRRLLQSLELKRVERYPVPLESRTLLGNTLLAADRTMRQCSVKWSTL